MIHVSSWLIITFIVFCQDAEAQLEVTSANPTTSIPVQPIAMFGANTDKDNLKGKVPWNIIPGGVPFNTDKDKYKPFIIYPPPKQWYLPNYGKPTGYFDKDWDPPKKKDDTSRNKDSDPPRKKDANRDKDWDPPKKKDDVDKKKKQKDLDDIPKSKNALKRKTLEDMLRERNEIMAFLSMPGYNMPGYNMDGFSRCLDGDKKFLDDKSECKKMKKNMARANKGPAMGNYCWNGQCQPQNRPPWPPNNSFLGGQYSYFPGSDSMDPSIPPSSPLAPGGFYNPDPSLNTPISPGPPYTYPLFSNPPYPFPQYGFQQYPYSQYPYYSSPYQKPPKYFPFVNQYQRYLYKPFFAEVETETPKLGAKEKTPLDEESQDDEAEKQDELEKEHEPEQKEDEVELKEEKSKDVE